MNRGEIRWHTFARPDKRRPVLILTRQPALSFLTKVTVAPLTSNIRNIRSEVVVEAGNGLRERSAVSLDNVTTVHVASLGQVALTTLDSHAMAEVEAAQAFALGFSVRLRP